MSDAPPGVDPLGDTESWRLCFSITGLCVMKNFVKISHPSLRLVLAVVVMSEKVASSLYEGLWSLSLSS